jgi:signal recognition particle subunit SRP54
MTKQERTNPDLLTRQPSRVRRIAKGSGSELEKVEQVLQQFNMMRAMMQQFSSFGGGFLNKIPGFGKLNAMRQMKDMDIGALFQELMGSGGGGPAMGGGLPGLGGLNLPPGYTPPGGKMQLGDRSTKSRSLSRNEKKRKRVAAKKARKK